MRKEEERGSRVGMSIGLGIGFVFTAIIETRPCEHVTTRRDHCYLRIPVTNTKHYFAQKVTFQMRS